MRPDDLVRLTREGTPPIQVTPRAAEAIQAAARQEAAPVAGLRVRITDGHGCCQTEHHALEFAREAASTDVVSESGGVRILLAPSDARTLRGAVLDYVETPQGAGFRLDVGQRTHQCGCDH